MKDEGSSRRSPRADQQRHLIVSGLDRIAAGDARATWSLAVAAVAVIGLADLTAGSDVSFSAFYLLPIFLVSAGGTRVSAAVISALAALTWLAADLVARGDLYRHAGIPVWNTSVRFTTLWTVGYLIIVLRETLDGERALSRTDALSGLLNTRAFSEAGEIELARMSRHRWPVTMVYLDVDRFKNVNDEFGHAAGDALLVLLATTLTMRCRMTDLVARLGGDEFAVLLPDTTVESAVGIIDDVRTELAAAAAEHGWDIGLSVGAVEFRTPPESVKAMVRLSDEVMYDVKRASKGTTGTCVMDAKELQRPPP